MMPRMLFALAVVIALSHPSAARDNDLESWYTYWGLGYVNNTYPDEYLDELNDSPDVDHIALALDTFGFYWPRGDKTLVGAIVNGNVDAYEGTFKGAKVELSLYNYLYALSTMYFLTHEIGQGPFVRADVGFAHSRINADVANIYRDKYNKRLGDGVPSGWRVRNSSDEWDAVASKCQLLPSAR